MRTYQRWVREGPSSEDKRPTTPPANMLSEQEKAEIIGECNSADFADLTPAQIVPKLADKGRYLASESTFYKVLKESKQNPKRTRVKTSQLLNL